MTLTINNKGKDTMNNNNKKPQNGNLPTIQMASFADYLKQPSFEDEIDTFVNACGDHNLYNFDNAADFIDQVLGNDDWETQLHNLGSLAAQLRFYGMYFEAIIDAAPKGEISIDLAVAHAKTINRVELQKSNKVRVVYNEADPAYVKAAQDAFDEAFELHFSEGISIVTERLLGVCGYVESDDTKVEPHIAAIIAKEDGDEVRQLDMTYAKASEWLLKQLNKAA